MNLSVFIVAKRNQRTTNLLETVKMSELESELGSLLKQFSLSRNSLEKLCDDHLFLDLMYEIPSFTYVAPFLGFTQFEIEAIQCDDILISSITFKMLRQWKAKNGSDATYLALVTIFLQMKDKHLAEYVMQYTKRTETG